MKEFIKSLKKIFKQKKGFTLIELLVVIGILGILAAALVATIDPVEQLNKATDANVKNTVVEYITANIRYFTTHQAMPWADLTAPASCYTSPPVVPSGAALSTAQMIGCTGALISDGELKTSFSTATNILKNINITGGANNAVIGCFIPVSKSQLKDQNTKYNITGTPYATPTTTCKGWGGSGVTDCYWCTQ